jgi:hypothetical protein
LGLEIRRRRISSKHFDFSKRDKINISTEEESSESIESLFTRGRSKLESYDSMNDRYSPSERVSIDFSNFQI